jgi:hypothetical protein
VTCWKVETRDGKLFVRDKEPEKKPRGSRLCKKAAPHSPTEKIAASCPQIDFRKKRISLYAGSERV